VGKTDTEDQIVQKLEKIHDELRKLWKDLSEADLQQKEKMFDEFTSNVKKRSLTEEQGNAALKALADISNQEKSDKH
jgi:t-SNARE complex subunit (syntaxin)